MTDKKQVGVERNDLRHEISLLLIKWHMPTRQVFISDVIKLIEEREEVARKDKDENK